MEATANNKEVPLLVGYFAATFDGRRTDEMSLPEP